MISAPRGTPVRREASREHGTRSAFTVPTAVQVAARARLRSSRTDPTPGWGPTRRALRYRRYRRKTAPREESSTPCQLGSIDERRRNGRDRASGSGSRLPCAAGRRPMLTRVRSFVLSVTGRDRPGIVSVGHARPARPRAQPRGRRDGDPARALRGHADARRAGRPRRGRAAGRPRAGANGGAARDRLADGGAGARHATRRRPRTRSASTAPTTPASCTASPRRSRAAA